jgi:cytochrome c553
VGAAVEIAAGLRTIAVGRDPARIAQTVSPVGGGEVAEHLPAHRGRPEKRVPSCADCHGPGRGDSAFAHLMRPVATRLTPEQMRGVAACYAPLPPGRE